MHCTRLRALATTLVTAALAVGVAACGWAGVRHVPAAEQASFGAAASVPSNAAPSAAPHITATSSAILRPLAGTPPSAFTAVAFLNAEEGWVGGDGTVGVTTDGGATWTWHALAGLTPESFAFADPRDGWLAAATDACFQSARRGAGCTTVLLHTADGGATWLPQDTVSCGNLCGPGKVQAADAAHAWALVGCRQGGVGGQPCTALLVTGDGGAHWRPVGLPAGLTPTDMDFIGASEGWVAGVRCPAGAAGPSMCPTVVAHTADGGGSWQTEALPKAWTGGGTLSFANAEDGWLVPSPADYCTMGGCWVALYATTDGGNTWVKVQSTYSRNGFQGHPTFVSPSVGFIPIAAGAGIGIGGVVRTADGGRTWSSAGDAESWSVGALSAVGPDDLWAIGAQKFPPVGPAPGFLVHSTDGGRTWSQELPVARPTTAVDFLDARTGFGIGTASDPGAVLATSDGGAHWSVVAGEPATGAQLRYIRFIGPLDGWVAGTAAETGPGRGGGPVVLATRDGGRTWTAIAHPTGAVMGLSRFDPTHGAMVTSTAPGGPTPARWATTANGGASWQPAAIVPAGGQLMDVAIVDPSHAWAMDFDPGHSLGFTLLLTADGGRSWVPLAEFPFGQAQIALFPTGPGTGWIVQLGQGKADLLHTTDGGHTWTRRTLAFSGVTDVDFISADRGWLLTSTGLWLTQDGGRTWAQVA